MCQEAQSHLPPIHKESEEEVVGDEQKKGIETGHNQGGYTDTDTASSGYSSSDSRPGSPDGQSENNEDSDGVGPHP